MDAKKFASIVGADFYAGVPDSQLKSLCDYLIDTYGNDRTHHLIAANEGNAVAIGAGYHLATGRVPVVYMQNSGEGNMINPAASLTSVEVYAIPIVYVIGWRGEPGVHDEPQHIFQGKVTIELLNVMEIDHFIVERSTTEDELRQAMSKFNAALERGRSVAFVVRKGALTFDKKFSGRNDRSLTREDAIRHVISVSGDDPIVSTTGKASRELFELRADHSRDFLTVGSMGHASSIALGLALRRSDRKVWCLDGDGAALMHMGSMAVIGTSGVKNLIHVVINNGAHESVGGYPTAASMLDIASIARACGYARTSTVDNAVDLDRELETAKHFDGTVLIEIKCSVGARKDLGRPTTSPLDNKKNFMRALTVQ
ncbi:MAG: phosphonopyruvate decarboxylase [Selenomonadaceae bacterium]|nr:phosphonopyruvate decarboxylase [Selenomonadaceae bacterium]